jgi:cytochrome c biogenesis protein CcdA
VHRRVSFLSPCCLFKLSLRFSSCLAVDQAVLFRVAVVVYEVVGVISWFSWVQFVIVFLEVFSVFGIVLS